MNLIIFFLLLSVLMNSIAQVSLKRGILAIEGVNLRHLVHPALFIRLLANPFISLWFLLLVPTMLLWLKVISMTELSFAYPFQSLSMVFISLGSIIFLKERISPRQWAGIFLILLGIILISSS